MEHKLEPHDKKVFDMWTRCTETAQGHEIKCKKGLWSVSAPIKADALREAYHYFLQYFEDGEYDT